MVALPSVASAQLQSWQDVQVADIETMKEKFIGLAQEFDESQYDWRPMEGVRSVRDVLALAVVEAHIFPTFWGYAPPAGAASTTAPNAPTASNVRPPYPATLAAISSANTRRGSNVHAPSPTRLKSREKISPSEG